MTGRVPTPREVLGILARDLSFDKIRHKFPELSDEKIREILSNAAEAAGTQHAAPQRPHSTHTPSEGKWIAHIDGASRGNPGPAASAAWVHTPHGILELKRSIGNDTNNAAEYEALLLVLETAIDRGIKNIEIRSDSELLVKQMKGQYRVKNQNLARRFIKAKNLEKMFKSFTINHVPREENVEADGLANEALDELMSDE
jgi:ribonuclease HI